MDTTQMAILAVIGFVIYSRWNTAEAAAPAPAPAAQPTAVVPPQIIMQPGTGVAGLVDQSGDSNAFDLGIAALESMGAVAGTVLGGFIDRGAFDPVTDTGFGPVSA